MVQEEIKELREEYETLFGKKAFGGWSEEELIAKIDAKKLGEEPKKVKQKEEVVNKGFEVDPSKTYHFRVLSRSTNPTKILPREAKVWCEETGTTRVIRLCSTEDSPYKDEQDPDALIDRKPIVITNGELHLSGTEANRVKFLLAFDGNAAKKKVLPINASIKGMYELVNKGQEVDLALSKDELELEAMLLIKNAKDTDLKNYMRSVYLLGVDGMTSKEIKLEANKKIKESLANARDILKDFNNPLHEVKSKVQRLFQLGELSDEGDVVKWKNGSVIIQIKSGERADHTLAKFVLEGSKQAKDFESVMNTKLD